MPSGVVQYLGKLLTKSRGRFLTSKRMQMFDRRPVCVLRGGVRELCPSLISRHFQILRRPGQCAAPLPVIREHLSRHECRLAFQRLRHTAMQPALPHSAQSGFNDLTQHIVRKPKCALIDLNQKTRSDDRLKCTLHLLLGTVRRAQEDCIRDVTSGNGRDPQQRARSFGQRCHPLLHALRDIPGDVGHIALNHGSTQPVGTAHQEKGISTRSFHYARLHFTGYLIRQQSVQHAQSVIVRQW